MKKIVSTMAMAALLFSGISVASAEEKAADTTVTQGRKSRERSRESPKASGQKTAGTRSVNERSFNEKKQVAVTGSLLFFLGAPC
ncbi:hypothetical protein ACEF06_22285 [Brevibacillus agri]|uniref:hypothetical protein n=1 Tax=Brevibacillus agri TaxID=51101 RepID=UPI003D202064